MTGAALICLRRDRRHLIRADWARLEHGVLTALTPYGVRSWPMSEVAVVKWLTDAQEAAA